MNVGCQAGPIVRSERSDWQAFAALQIADGIVGPCIANGDRVGDVGTRDFNFVLAENLSFRPPEDFVFASHGQPDRSSNIERIQASANVVHRHDDLVAIHFERFEFGTAVRNVDSVVFRQRPASQTFGDVPVCFLGECRELRRGL